MFVFFSQFDGGIGNVDGCDDLNKLTLYLLSISLKIINEIFSSLVIFYINYIFELIIKKII
jgi:hypothetical protein